MNIPTHQFTKTLIYQAPGTTALLMTTINGKTRARIKRGIQSGPAALAWCDKNGACLIYMPCLQVQN